jgi:hypothetical protein
MVRYGEEPLATQVCLFQVTVGMLQALCLHVEAYKGEENVRSFHLQFLLIITANCEVGLGHTVTLSVTLLDSFVQSDTREQQEEQGVSVFSPPPTPPGNFNRKELIRMFAVSLAFVFVTIETAPTTPSCSSYDHIAKAK